MADLSLKITANTAAASAAFKDMAESSEFLQKKIAKLGEDMGNNNADRFIQQQKLSGIAMQAVGKETEGLTKQHAAYEREIVKLINSGLGPESEAVQKLKKEYDGLTKEIEKETAARKAQENAWKVAAAGLAGLAAGVGAFIGFSIKSAASIEDMTAAFTPMMGSTEKATELVNRLNKEAVTTPFELDNISKSVRRLLPAFGGDMNEAIKAFRMIGDTAGGNAQALETMTMAYSNVKMTGKASLEDLNRIANSGVPIFTELAKSQNKTVAEIRQMTSDGEISAEVLTDVFRTMTSEGGLFFEGMETSAFTFSSTMLGIKENVGLVAGQIGQRFLPNVKEMSDRVAETVANFSVWISQGDNLTNLLDTLTYAIAGVSAGLVAFLVVAKGATVINILTAAFSGLTAAIAANPIGAIAVVITAVLIPAIIYVVKNFDSLYTRWQQIIARLAYAFQWLGSQIKEKFTVAINSVKIAFISLAEIVVTKVLGSVAKLLDVLGKIPGVGEGFKAAAAAVRGFSDGFRQATQEARNASQAAIQAAKDEQDAAQAGLNAKLANIDAEARARRAAIEERKAQDEEERALASEAALVEDENDIVRQEEKLAKQQEIANARVAAEAAADAEELDGKKKLADEEIALLEKRAGALTQFTGGFSDLLDTMAEKSTAAAIASRAVASAEALINSYLAFTKALAAGVPPFNYIAAAGVLAAGLAQQIKIHATPIPSAETGASFMVPNEGSVDSRLVRVNPGEQIDITPRGGAGAGVFNFQFIMDGAVFAEAMNKQAIAGNLHTLQLAGNY